MLKLGYEHRRYQVQPYNPSWPRQFETETKTLKDVFGKDAVSIEHIGSTAVPGMASKPTIDILILVDNLSVADKHVQEMKTVGYEHLINFVLPGSVLFRHMKDNVLLSNVHIFAKDHPHVLEMLSLRDYLRSHPEEVKAYSDTKRNLFEKYPNDYATYRRLKDAYMKALKKRVKSGNRF